MTMLRKAVTFLTFIALAGNSVAASLRPCCCTERQQRQAKPAHACCEQASSEMPAAEKSAAPPHEGPSCCASKVASGEGSLSLPTMGQNPCCCIKALPAIPPAREEFGFRSLSSVDPALVGDCLHLADFPPAKQRIRRGEPGLLFATAPHLCALYCIWLN